MCKMIFNHKMNPYEFGTVLLCGTQEAVEALNGKLIDWHNPQPGISKIELRSPEDAKELMNELWRTGVRPDKDVAEELGKADVTAAQLTETKEHLADMREIALSLVRAQTKGESTCSPQK